MKNKYTQVLLDKKINGEWNFQTLWIPSDQVRMGREIEDGWKITEIYSGVSADLVKKYPKDFKTKIA